MKAIPPLKELPPPPVSFASLVTLLSAGEPEVAQLHTILRHDPGLTIRLLSAANSARLAGEPTTDIRRAIVRIGIQETCRLALLSSAPFLKQDLREYSCSLWKGALQTARAAEALARIRKLPNPGTLFCAGMLVDVGKLVVDGSLQGISDDRSLPFWMRERALLGHDHAVAGGCLLRQWGLPEALADLVEHHHDPANAADPASATVLHLADALCRGLHPVGIDAGQNPLQPGCSDGLGLTAAQIDSVLLGVQLNSEEVM